MKEFVKKILKNEIGGLSIFSGYEPNLKFLEAFIIDTIKNLKVLRNPEYETLLNYIEDGLLGKNPPVLLILTEEKEYIKKLKGDVVVISYNELPESVKLKPLSSIEIKEIMGMIYRLNIDEIIESLGSEIDLIYEAAKLMNISGVDDTKHILQLFEKPYFDLFIKGIILNDKKLLMRELKKKISANEKPYAIIASIFWVMKKIIEAKSIETLKKTFFKIKDYEFGINKKLLDLEAIKRNLKLIAEYDALYKYGSIDGYVATELIAAKLWN